MHDEHEHDYSHEHGAVYIPPPEEHRDLTPEQVTGLRDNYVTVLSTSAQGWFTNGGIDVVNSAVFKYIQHHPRLFDPLGDVIFENIEMANLVLAGQELGLKEPEELCVGLIPRQVGMIKPKGEPQPEVMKNTILIGNAEEVGGMVMAAFRAYYKLEEEVRPKKTARDRAEERKRQRKKDKRRGKR